MENIENNIDYIKSVKEQTTDGEVTGYLVNGSMSVPKSEQNRHYKDVKVWLESNTPEPEFTQEELDKQAQDKTNSEARQALVDGDWKIIRELERQFLSGSELNETREALRASVKEGA